MIKSIKAYLRIKALHKASETIFMMNEKVGTAKEGDNKGLFKVSSELAIQIINHQKRFLNDLFGEVSQVSTIHNESAPTPEKHV